MAKRTPLELARLVRLQELSKRFERFKKGRPTIDTGLGFSVQGGYEDKQNLEVARRQGLDFVRGSDDQFHIIDPATDWDIILSAIDQFGIQSYQRKWQLEAAINASETVEAVNAIDLTL